MPSRPSLPGGRAAETPPPRDRPWLKHYPPEVPAEIDVASLGTLADLFRDSVAGFGDRPVLQSFGARMSFSALGREADAVAAWLQGQGISRGDRVAIMLPNVMAYGAILFGTLLAGGVVVNVNPLYTARELTYQLRDSGARVLFVLENFACTVVEAKRDLGLERIVVVTPGDGLGARGRMVDFVSRHVRRAVPSFDMPDAVAFRDVLALGRKGPPRPVDLGTADLAFLQYTGGTTGVAKGAMLTHGNVAANVAQIEAWMRPSIGAVAHHVMITALPLYHIFALTVCAMLMLRLGGCQILIANPRDVPGLVKVLAGNRFTLMAGVNTLYAALAAHPGLRKVDFSPVVACVAGGMATQPKVARLWKDLTGRPITEGYGLSETAPLVTSNRLDLTVFSGKIGYPVSSTDVVLLDGEDRPAAAGEPGELCVRGPQVMAGYWRRAAETAKVMTRDGFLRTGDIAVMDAEGALRIVDRKKDMVLVSGFNVYPAEVEEVLCGHPGVREAAVIGLPDPHFGESVIAVVALKDPALDEATLRAWCREVLTPYKVPRRIVFRDDLPKSPVGKLLRRILRDEFVARAAESESAAS